MARQLHDSGRWISETAGAPGNGCVDSTRALTLAQLPVFTKSGTMETDDVRNYSSLVSECVDVFNLLSFILAVFVSSPFLSILFLCRYAMARFSRAL